MEMVLSRLFPAPNFCLYPFILLSRAIRVLTFAGKGMKKVCQCVHKYTHEYQIN